VEIISAGHLTYFHSVQLTLRICKPIELAQPEKQQNPGLVKLIDVHHGYFDAG
jgi:hypothetical protein